MTEREWLSQQFEEKRTHLRGVAYRMLGSLSEAEDAVQEAWLRLNRSDANSIENLSGWLTTVVSRVCLDMLRSRKSRREDSIDTEVPEPIASHKSGLDPETEVLMADSVGLAMLVVLDALTPAERLAFVLHDMFDLSFDEIAAIVGRTPNAARQLASRARRRVRGKEPALNADLSRQREVIEAFLAAARAGDFNALINLLDPDVVLRADPAAVPPGAPTEIRSAAAIATRAIQGGARAARPALVDGAVGVIVAPRGRLFMVIRCNIANGKIVSMDAIANPERIRQLDLSVLNG
jgi:RNA polymerase sigma factor (sigma-70 family)